jgi:hypothetical protein
LNELEQSLIRWAHEGLVSADQARRIRDFEQSDLPESDDFGISLLAPVGAPASAVVTEQPAAVVASEVKPDRSAIATEAIAYVGGMLFLIGYGVVVGTQWSGMNSFARFAVLALPAIITFVAGLGMGQQKVESFKRIGYALWALSTGFFASAVAVAFQDFVEWTDTTAIAAGALCVAGFAVGQYVFRRSALQQLIAFVSIAVLSCALLARVNDSIPIFWFGALVVVQGLAWLLFTWADVIRPRRDGIIQGAGGALIAAQVMVTSMTDAALVLGMTLGAVFLVVGVLTSTTVLFTIGAIGLFVFAYESVLAWIGSSVVTNSILLAVGVLVLGGVVVRLQLKGRS